MPTLCTTADKAVAALIGAQDVSTYNYRIYNTKKTYMFRKTLELKELACRLSDTAIELKEHCILMRDVDATEKTNEYPLQTSEQLLSHSLLPHPLLYSKLLHF